MSPKTPLRSFLRKDILRNRINTAPLRRRSQYSPKTDPEEPHELDYLVDKPSAEHKDYTPDADTDSLLGEPTVEKTKEEKLQRLLSESDRTSNLAQRDKYTEIEELKLMKKELEELVTEEGEAEGEEKSNVRTQKRILIRKIAAFEAGEKGKRAKELKSNLDQMSKYMPACEPGQKKTLIAKADKIYQAFAGTEKVPLKRNRENIDNDLDGEERLAMGRTIKRPATKVTGRWGATLHDYFPDVEGKGGNIDRNKLTAEQKSLNRRELAELGEVLAKAERKKKKLLE